MRVTDDFRPSRRDSPRTAREASTTSHSVHSLPQAEMVQAYIDKSRRGSFILAWTGRSARLRPRRQCR